MKGVHKKLLLIHTTQYITVIQHTSHCEEEDGHLWYQLGTVISQGNPFERPCLLHPLSQQKEILHIMNTQTHQEHSHQASVSNDTSLSGNGCMRKLPQGCACSPCTYVLELHAPDTWLLCMRDLHAIYYNCMTTH